MTCPHCGSDNVAPRTSFRPRCEQTGYDDGGEFMECVTCGTKGDLVDFADDADLEKLYEAIMSDRDDPGRRLLAAVMEWREKRQWKRDSKAIRRRLS